MNRESEVPQPAILVVDDRRQNLVAMRSALAGLPCTILEASSGQEAVELALVNPDLAVILLDVQMPIMDGFETAETLRFSNSTKGIPIIFVTAASDDATHIFHGYECGAVDFLAKPVSEPIVRSKVSVFLELARKQQTLKSALTQLKRSESELQRNNQALRDFVANMSHEIRTPLNGIIGVADLLLEAHLDAQAHDHVQTIVSSSGHLLKIINNLLDFSKIEADQIELEQIPTNVPKLLEGMVDLLKPTAHVPMALDISPDFPAVLNIDPVRLRQVMVNLTSNAVKFTETGRITISARVLAHVNGQARIEFAVTDTGPGIPESVQDSIFSAFKQASNSTSREHGGTGLGLSISTRLVGLMGGHILLKSSPGQGSRFYFTVNLEVGAALIEDESDEEVDINGLRVLVVDDNMVNRMVARAMLEREGSIVTTADDGLEAVEAWKTQTFDVILMDWRMPKLDGIQATQKIRAQESEGEHVVIIGASANSTTEDRERCYQAGMDDYITKPFRLKQLVGICSRWAPTLAVQS